VVEAAAGNLDVVGAVTIAPPTGYMTYYQGGNITVEPGGHLTVVNTSLVFAQFVGHVGTLADRLRYIYSLLDYGNLTLENSTITTDLSLLNPFPFLNVWVDNGSLEMTNSSLAFAGTVNVTGPSADVWASASSIVPNPDAPLLASVESNQTGQALEIAQSLVHVSQYAPSISVEDGAHVTLLSCLQSGTYAAGPDAAAPAGLTPDYATAPGGGWLANGSAALNITGFRLPSNNSSALALEATYPQVHAAYVNLDYNATTTMHASSSQFIWGNRSWPLPQVNFTSTGDNLSVALPNGAVQAINRLGIVGFLEGVGTEATVQVGALNVSSATVTLTAANISFSQFPSYNLTVTGNGSVLTAAGTEFDFNWNPMGSVVGNTTAWWTAQKMTVANGANAFLADIAIPEPVPVDYAHESVVVPLDNASHVAFYQWLVVPVLSSYGYAVAGASVSAYYAYSGAGTDNATVVALNYLSSADPDLAQYVAQWDATHGVTGYGRTNPLSGNATLLLATDTLTARTLPDGQFLGDYHVGVTPQNATQGPTSWIYATLPLYPDGLWTGKAGVPPGPAVTHRVLVPGYSAELSVIGPTVTVDGAAAPNDTVAIGQTLTVNETVKSTGTASVSGITALLSYSQPGRLPLQVDAVQVLPALPGGASRDIAFNWSVDPTIVGIHPSIQGTFTLVVSWSPGNGWDNQSATVIIVPPYITVHLAGFPSGPDVAPGSPWTVQGGLLFVGGDSAWVNITVLGGTTGGFSGGDYLEKSGNVTFNILVPATAGPGAYTIELTVYHDDRTLYRNYTNAFQIPSPPPPAAALPWYQQTFAGLALWLWLVLVAVIVAGLLAFLLFTRRAGKGKFVECGECGALIPEDAPNCPKCGAEFETESVRCSRCGATIAATSKFCPECAVTLIGRGADERDDPERQGYADFVERYRVDARKELGDNYTEGSFWDWWRRQQSYASFTQWHLQQMQGSRAGMTAPRELPPPPGPAAPSPPPPKGGAGAVGSTPTPPTPPVARPPPSGGAGTATAAAGTAPGTTTICPTCRKEIAAVYIVCPFCGGVTR
jgi:hypothetical protein